MSKRKVAPVAEIVRKLADPPVQDTAIQVIGTVTLDPINYQEFVSTFNASRQCEQWTVKKVKIAKISEIDIFEEIDSKSATMKKTHFWL